jgi:hypothetical protein
VPASRWRAHVSAHLRRGGNVAGGGGQCQCEGGGKRGGKRRGPYSAMDLEERIRLVRETLEHGAEAASAVSAARAWCVREEGGARDRFLSEPDSARGSPSDGPGPSLGSLGGRLEGGSEVRECTHKGGLAGCACVHILLLILACRKTGRGNVGTRRRGSSNDPVPVMSRVSMERPGRRFR